MSEIDAWTVGPPPSPPPGPGRRGAVLVVLALVAGFVGGIAAGYALDDQPPDDEVRAVGDALGSASAGDESWEAGSASDSVTATTFVGSAPGSESDVWIGPGERSRLFRRDSASGYSVRVFSRENGRPPSMPCATGQWCPPPECFPTSVIEVDVVTEWTVTSTGASNHRLRDGDVVRILSVVVNWRGQQDDESVFGVIARVADGVRAVRLSSNGVTDEMAPVDGIVVLVVPSASFDPRGGIVFPADATIEAIDGSGTSHDIPMSVGGEPEPQCVPPPPGPPPLPAAGEQPADAAAQDAAVRERFVYLFGPENSAERLVEVVDDPTGLDELRVKLREGHPNEVGNVEYEVGELVFTSPDTAAYTFRPVVAGRPLPWQIGGARFIDGNWMITRATVCAMYRLGGANC